MKAAGEPPRIDFFISYTAEDHSWAEWIAWQLEASGYSVLIQAWDFQPGNNFLEEMDRATERAAKTLAVLSVNYLSSTFGRREWQARMHADPDGAARALLPVRVGECEPAGLLGPIVYVDLVGLDETQARERLLAGAQEKRWRPPQPPIFPGHSAPPTVASPKPPFPPPTVGEDVGPPATEPPVVRTTEPPVVRTTEPPVVRPTEPPVVRTTEPPVVPTEPPWWADVAAAAANLLRFRKARAVVVLVALAIVAAAAVISVLPSGSAAEPAFTQVGVSPRALALGLGDDDRLWVADPTQPEAWWLDATKRRPRTNQLFLEATARPTGVAVDAPRETAWMVDERHDLAWRIDIHSRHVVDRVQVGDGPQSVAVAGDVVWIANRDGTVSMINAANGLRISPDITIGGRLTGIAADRDSVWVTDTADDVVWRIDAASLAKGMTQDYASSGPRSVAVNEGAAWVANRDGTVSRIDDHGVTTIDVGEELCGISVGEGAVWVSDPVTDLVWRIDPHHDKVSGKPFQVEDAPCAVAAGHGSVWVANRGDSSISRIRP
jgi:DNA-binding beta-propeller fold protein YncE